MEEGKIMIDKEGKLILLKWLKQGWIDSFELEKLSRQATHPSKEELIERLKYLYSKDEGATCRELIKWGFCIKEGCK